MTPAFDDACRRLEAMACADALWQRRLDIWPSDAASQASVATRLGWLGALDFIEPQLPRLRALADDVRRDGFTDVVLLGMGGSSLAPEVLRQVVGVSPGFPRFRMLDSVDPDAVRTALADAATSLFVFASKSGSTIEPHAMALEARRRVMAAGHEWGSRVIAITDEKSTLHTRAVAERYRDVFINPADIGGRYSALSFFGLVPAALMGIDLDELIRAARQMEADCRVVAARDNPGLALGALMAAGESQHRNKLTLLLPGPLQSLGLWVEQLVAESTGKQGRGVVPIAGEPASIASGADRVHVVVRLAGDSSEALPSTTDIPTVEMDVPGPLSIGAEFFRWEFATAVAGALMGINPFDEPDVASAKRATREILDAYATTRRLMPPECHESVSGVRLTLSAAAAESLDGRPASAFLRLARPGDYCALLAYLPPDAPPLAGSLHDLRVAVGAATRCATMFGYGPRYLHSTGQLHKGGPNEGVFLVISADGVEDQAVPGELYSFAVLELAQAIGDFNSLSRAGRRALHLHFPSRRAKIFEEMARILVNTAELHTN